MTLHRHIKKRLTQTQYLKHETKKNILIKFLLFVSILILYFIFISFQNGLKNGFMVTLLTWTFFVFCTPIADAGTLVGFPMRLITKMRMIYSQILVFIIGFIINIFAFTFTPQIYEKTEILKLFKHIITTPYPFWSIIILSAIGTFLSIYFGDELMDVAKHKHRIKYKKHKNKYQFIIILFIIIFTILIYIYLLKQMDINIPFQ